MVMNPIPGVAGTDYPVFSEVPDTGFDCNQQNFPGIYTDTEADCQVFYMCEPNGRSTGFLCPNGKLLHHKLSKYRNITMDFFRTMFNQQYFVCDW